MAKATQAHSPQNLSVQQAAAKIVALINSSPRSPWPWQIESIIATATTGWQPLEPSDAALVCAVRAAISRCDEAERRSVKLDGEEAAYQQQAKVCEAAWADLEAIEKQIPNPPRSPVHVLLQAEIAYHGADKTPDDRLAGLSVDDCFERPATRLIEAVLAYFGGQRP